MESCIGYIDATCKLYKYKWKIYSYSHHYILLNFQRAYFDFDVQGKFICNFPNYVLLFGYNEQRHTTILNAGHVDSK